VAEQEQDSLVEQQTTQSGEVPQTQVLTGWLSESSQPDHRRLLLDPAGNRYLEIPTEDIVLTRPLDSAESSTGLGGSAVFVKQTAQMVFCRCRPVSVTDFVRLRRAAARLAAAPQPTGATTRGAYDPYIVGGAGLLGGPGAAAATGLALQGLGAAGIDPAEEVADFFGGFF
jgi:hypothetical protein